MQTFLTKTLYVVRKLKIPKIELTTAKDCRYKNAITSTQAHTAPKCETQEQEYTNLTPARPSDRFWL